MYSTVSRCRCRCAHSEEPTPEVFTLNSKHPSYPKNHATTRPLDGDLHTTDVGHIDSRFVQLGRPPVRSPKSLHYTSHHTDSFFTSGSACSSLSSHVYTAARGSASRTDTAVTSGCERVTASSIQFPLAVGLGLRNNSYSMRARDESSLTGFAQEFDRGSAPSMGLQTAPLRA